MLGYYFLNQHELLLVGMRGSMRPDPRGMAGSVIRADRREHSRKPDEVYEIIEGMYPEGPYLELFARRRRRGWHAFGNEVRGAENARRSPLAST